MIKRADPIPILDGFSIQVVHIEDIIGLKIQATVNDPSRATSDWAAIRMLPEAAGVRREPIDWALVSDYLEIFRLEARFLELKSYYGTSQ